MLLFTFEFVSNDFEVNFLSNFSFSFIFISSIGWRSSLKKVAKTDDQTTSTSKKIFAEDDDWPQWILQNVFHYLTKTNWRCFNENKQINVFRFNDESQNNILWHSFFAYACILLFVVILWSRHCRCDVILIARFTNCFSFFRNHTLTNLNEFIERTKMITSGNNQWYCATFWACS